MTTGDGSRAAVMNSHVPTLVETVNINYEEFCESFFTCSTCLCHFDAAEHNPKLLGCSHHVCSSCLERITHLPQSRDTGSFRCPICRETIPVPRGGVTSFPPAFMVNQLMDIVLRQRRDIVPKCSSHPQDDLLFCETCERVFCPKCQDVYHNDDECDHTVVPFSVAKKRMSEIMLFKASQCSRLLRRAAESVDNEINLLDINVNQLLDQVNSSFQGLTRLLEVRRSQITENVKNLRDEKRRVLQDQLKIIDDQRSEVEQECSDLQYQVEPRSITTKINKLNSFCDTAQSLMEPRENAFLRFDCQNYLDIIQQITHILGRFGSVAVSRTKPSLCTPIVNKQFSAQLCDSVLIKTIDYQGLARTTGGDPVEVVLVNADTFQGPELATLNAMAQKADNRSSYTSDNIRLSALMKCVEQVQDSPPMSKPKETPFDIAKRNNQIEMVNIVDQEDGTYLVWFRPSRSGMYFMQISIFGRPIKNSPIRIEVLNTHSPVWQYGGSDQSLSQPVRVASDINGQIYVLDTGNNRLKVMLPDGNVVRTIETESCFQKNSVLGLALCYANTRNSLVFPTLFLLNWRSKRIFEFSSEGFELKSFTYSEFQEPIDLAIDNHNVSKIDGPKVIIADDGQKKVYVFSADSSKLLSSFAVLPPIGAPKGAATTITQCSRSVSSDGSQSSPPKRRKSLHLTCVASGLNGDVLVGSNAGIQLYDSQGNYRRMLGDDDELCSDARVGGIAVDLDEGMVFATITEKTRTFVMVCDYKDGSVLFAIDSHNAKLRRPSGVCVSSVPAINHILVADLGNNAIKKFRYK